MAGANVSLFTDNPEVTAVAAGAVVGLGVGGYWSVESSSQPQTHALTTQMDRLGNQISLHEQDIHHVRAHHVKGKGFVLGFLRHEVKVEQHQFNAVEAKLPPLVPEPVIMAEFCMPLVLGPTIFGLATYAVRRYLQRQRDRQHANLVENLRKDLEAWELGEALPEVE